MTKAETIKFLVNAIFSFTKKFKVRKNYITPNGKIFVDFIGKIDDQTVSTRFICTTRKQVAYILNHFRAAKNGVMEWVKIINISNIKRGYVMNSKRQWKKRNRTFEFRIIKKQVTELKEVKSAVIAKNDNTPRKKSRFEKYHKERKEFIMKLTSKIQELLNNIQRSTFEIGITRTGTKENKKAREALAQTKDAINAITKELTIEFFKMEDRQSEKAKQFLITKTQLATSIVDEYEEIGGDDAKRIKMTVKDLTAYRKAYRKGLIKYDPVEQKAHHDAEKEIRRFVFYIVNNYDEEAERSAEDLRKVLATGIITIGEYLNHMEYFKSMYTLNKH